MLIILINSNTSHLINIYGLQVFMNHYQTLGVQPDADIIVIKAAYKALARKYHPDTSDLPKREAETKIKAINEAYEILSNPKSRSAYDESIDTSSYEPEEAAAEQESAFDAYYEDKWKFAIEYFPSLASYYKDLRQVSNSLAQSYRMTIISGVDYGNQSKLKHEMLDNYLQLYFGKDKFNKEFGLSLLRNNNRLAARELNKAICQFGNSIDSWDLREKIKVKYQIKEEEPQGDGFSDEDSGFFDTAMGVLLLFLGFVVFLGVFLDH